mgnify:CR=1 FL=1
MAGFTDYTEDLVLDWLLTVGAATRPTASWGTVVAVGIFDATTAGNLLAYANLSSSAAITTGDVLRFNTGALTVTLD